MKPNLLNRTLRRLQPKQERKKTKKLNLKAKQCLKERKYKSSEKWK